MKIIIRILRTFKNILFPKIYMPWEQNDLDNVSSAELQELITLIDARLAELDKLMNYVLQLQSY